MRGDRINRRFEALMNLRAIAKGKGDPPPEGVESAELRLLRTREWRSQDLEDAGRCQVCGSNANELAYEGLEDTLFFCAPGKWDILRCADCSAGYVSPRPTITSIGSAYETYYTHTRPERLGRLSQFKLAATNGYRNWRFGTTHSPASPVGVWIASIFPNIGKTADARMRNLPRPPNGARLLDVGFGSGEFLERARSAGWNVVGVDIDETAVKNALDVGLDAVSYTHLTLPTKA